MSFMHLPTSWTDGAEAPASPMAFMPTAFTPAAFTPAAFTGLFSAATPANVTEFWSQLLQPWAAWVQMSGTLLQSASPWSLPRAQAPLAAAAKPAVAPLSKGSAKFEGAADVAAVSASTAASTAASVAATASKPVLTVVQGARKVAAVAGRAAPATDKPWTAARSAGARPAAHNAAATATQPTAAVKATVTAAPPAGAAVFTPRVKSAAVKPALKLAPQAPVKRAVEQAVKKAVKKVASPAVKASKPDDLTVIEGIGPQIAAKLVQAGIAHFSTLASAPAARLNAILAAAGPRFKLARPETWAEQAGLLARGDKAAFDKLTAELRAGVRA